MESAVKKEELDSSEVNLSNDKHARRLLAALNATRNDEHLCDAVVIIGECKIHIQKAVLAAASHYFRSVFSYEVINGSTKSEVDLTSMEITVDTFRTILNYIYTSEIKLCEDNIQDMLQASDVFLLGDLKEMCCDYLESCISPQNCLGILDFSARFSCPWVHLKATRYIDKHFRDVVETEEFMKLDAKTLTSLLTRITLEAGNSHILNCILAWYNYNKEERDIQVGTVLQICYPGLHVRGFEMERLLSELQNKIEELDLPMRGQRDVILVCGGEELVAAHGVDCTNEVVDTVHCVDPFECRENFKNNSYKRWRKLAPLSTARTGHETVECGGCVYAIGGRSEVGRILNTVEKYDPLTNTWTKMASMNDERTHFGAVSVKGNIYVFGGSKRYVDPDPTVEVYNIFLNTWRRLPDMNIRRQWFTCVAVNKVIYVIGGGSQHKIFEAVECFDTSAETWFSVSPLREKRCSGRAVAIDGDIYLFGGIRRIECPSAMMHGGSIKHCGIEMYSSQVKTWIPLMQRNGNEGSLCLHPEKSRLESAVAIGDIIFVIGKLDLGTKFKETIRAYDRQTQTWFCAVPDPPESKAPLGGCVLKVPNSTFNGGPPRK